MSETTSDLSVEAERVLGAQLAQLEEIQGRLQADMTKTPGYLPGYGRDSSSLARAIVEVSGEIRQLARVGKDKAGEMTKAEKLELLVEVFPTMPTDEQRAMVAKLRKMIPR